MEDSVKNDAISKLFLYIARYIFIPLNIYLINFLYCFSLHFLEYFARNLTLLQFPIIPLIFFLYNLRLLYCFRYRDVIVIIVSSYIVSIVVNIVVNIANIFRYYIYICRHTTASPPLCVTHNGVSCVSWHAVCDKIQPCCVCVCQCCISVLCVCVHV